ncbi:MAG: hypothetical protein BGO40_07285 [Chryseobacterium sp. 39-10]|nr:MAG: hypothetical protein BGO40_07285 [Chryseobacterium sp. 39-10]
MVYSNVYIFVNKVLAKVLRLSYICITKVLFRFRKHIDIERFSTKDNTPSLPLNNAHLEGLLFLYAHE